MGESLDIIEYMDKNPAFGPVNMFKPITGRTDILAWQKKVKETHRYVHIYIYIHIYLFMYKRAHVCVYIYLYIYIYIYLHIYIYIYIYMYIYNSLAEKG
jgi:glutaredoxin 2